LLYTPTQLDNQMELMKIKNLFMKIVLSAIRKIKLYKNVKEEGEL